MNWPLVVAAYIAGAIPFGLLLVRAITGRDIRAEGSGNIGAMNVFRTSGPALGVAVLVLDLLKGLVPVLLARRMDLPPPTLVIVGLAAIAGHNWSVFLRGKGGKGIATSYGVLLGLSPVAGILAGLIWIAVVVVTRYASLASLLGMLAVPVVIALRREPPAYLAFGLVAVVFAFYRHRTNITRLLRGEELRLSWKADAGSTSAPRA
jgi:acyl phosphate:glycerol-3-phosphate acyltransferase